MSKRIACYCFVCGGVTLKRNTRLIKFDGHDKEISVCNTCSEKLDNDEVIRSEPINPLAFSES